ncbi:MAG: carbon starvation protein A [Elusimicrobia bacterium]|nr:carbon starvation protein A [Elusimicrobiota bacterium]
MPLVVIGLGGALALALGYIFYGRFVGRVFGLDPKRVTPAVAMNDGNDYVPAKPVILLGQHFAAIAAVGPIAGPILAAGKYGWALSWIWVVLGAIFIGAVHDFSALMASVRHQARSIAEVVGIHINPFAQKIFLVFIWLSLLYVILVFTDLTAAAFISRPELGEQNFGPGVATTSIFYLILALGMGAVMRKNKLSLSLLTIIGVGLLLFFIRLGQHFPLALGLKTWQIIILGYCFVVSVIPLWTLLQPRGYLGGFLLYASLAAGIVGFLFYRPAIPSGWTPPDTHWIPTGVTVFPFLFTTIACGACSGFHGLVSSGTTSKQIAKETDAKIVGYGGMLLEAFVALVALGAFITMSAEGKAAHLSPDEIYARGLAAFMTVGGIPYAFGVSFGKLAFATFIYDTLDVSTRLGRYIFQELTGLAGPSGKYLGTGVTMALPLIILLAAKPGAPPAWKAYWPLFGASNQLLACLTLAAVTVWLKKEKRQWLVTAIPCAFMAVVTLAALAGININWIKGGLTFSLVNAAGALLFLLAIVFLYQAGKAFLTTTAHDKAKIRATV